VAARGTGGLCGGERVSWRDANRQTGRTTRMLEAAVKAASEGRAVYVIMADDAEVQRAKRILIRILSPRMVAIDWKCPLGISVEPMRNWEPLTEMPRGAHPNCRLFVDHYAIERRHSALLDMLHEWDVEVRG